VDPGRPQGRDRLHGRHLHEIMGRGQYYAHYFCEFLPIFAEANYDLNEKPMLRSILRKLVVFM
jgi:hypothetical protein